MNLGQVRERLGGKMWPQVLLVAALLLCGLVFRAAELERLPGFNGDEAWPAVKVRQFLHGEQVDWNTPSGRKASVIYTALGVASELLVPTRFPPDLTTVRLPAMICGVAAVLLTFLLMRRAFDPTRGAILAVLVAATPVLIAYSRIGWEPALLPPLGALLIYFSARRHLLGVIATWTVGLLSHPVFVFLFPMSLLPIMVSVFRDDTLSRARRKLVAILYLAGLVGPLVVNAALAPPGKAFAECVRMQQFPAFFVQYLRQLSGANAYEYLCAPLSGVPLAVHDWGFGAVFLGALAAGGYLFVARRMYTELALLAGLLLSVVAFFLFGGVKYVGAGHSRHSLVLALPSAVVLGLCLCALFRERAIWVAAGVSALLLASFAYFFFGELSMTGGRAHETFRTASVEPKVAAYRIIERNLVPVLQEKRLKTAAPEILVEDWNTQWPIRYLADGFPGVGVPRHEQFANNDGKSKELMENGGHAVVIPGGNLEKLLNRLFGGPDRFESWDVNNDLGTAVYRVLRLKR